MTRRDGHWYVTRTLEDTDALLQAADAAQAEHDARQAAEAEAAAAVKDDASASAKP